MDDVKVYKAFGVNMVSKIDFDAQRLRADTAEAELAKMTADRDSLKGIASAYIASDGAKDLRIVAAEQRIAELIKVMESLPFGLHPSTAFIEGDCQCSQCEFVRAVRAALNPKPEAGSHE